MKVINVMKENNFDLKLKPNNGVLEHERVRVGMNCVSLEVDVRGDLQGLELRRGRWKCVGWRSVGRGDENNELEWGNKMMVCANQIYEFRSSNIRVVLSFWNVKLVIKKWCVQIN